MELHPRRLGSHVVGYLRARPLLCLVLLSPGIPEYLSGSSSWAVLTANPIVFFLFVGLNVGLYGSGVIVIREAMIRWRKGWASVFLLGFAYGIVEEGLALSTFFNPNAGPVGVLGVYGHWLGVSWVWTVGLLLFHSAISIALPIFLFRLTFPALKSTSLVTTGRAIVWMGVLFFDSLILFFMLNYWAGWPVILSSLLAVSICVLAARRVPASFLRTGSSRDGRRPLTLAILGALFFPATILTGGVAAVVNAPFWIPMGLEIVISYVILREISRSFGIRGNEARKTGLAIGLVIPIMVFGLIASLASTPIILVVDFGFAIFLRRLWKRYRFQPLALLARSLPTFSSISNSQRCESQWG